jgi:hypothetical protein
MHQDSSPARGGAEVVPLASAMVAARDGFLRWQCRVRRFSARRDGGRPGPAIRPKVLAVSGAELSAGIVTVLIERNPEWSTDVFRQAYRRTCDPAERRAAALALLAEAFFQQPSQFSDTLTALFLPGSILAARLGRERACVLDFDDGATRFALTCRVDDLDRDRPFYQATWYHNALFNPNLPAEARVLAFIPDWTRLGSSNR